MEAAKRIQADPLSSDWGDLRWEAWCPLHKTGGKVQKWPGIYRVRQRGHAPLIYVGISGRLRSRIGNLRRGVQTVLEAEDPATVGWQNHSAARCVAGHIPTGGSDIIEISWAAIVPEDGRKLSDKERRKLMELEADLIAACRWRYGQSPACQFHGAPL